MPVIIPESRPPKPPPVWQRFAWFVALYAAGVGTVGLVAYGLRLWIKP